MSQCTTAMSATTPPDEASSANTTDRAKPITIVIANDHPIFRDGLKQLLSLEKDFAVVAEIGDGDEVLPAVERYRPDILLLDLKLPGTHGLTVLQKLQLTNNTATKVIVLTVSEDKNEFVQAMKLGTSGIVLKQSPTDLLFKSIRKVHAGEIWLDSDTTAAVMQQFAPGEDHGPAAGPKASKIRKWRRRCSSASRQSRTTCTTSSISWAYSTGWNWRCTPSKNKCTCRSLRPGAGPHRSSGVGQG